MTLTEAQKLPLLHRFYNGWRKRNVEIRNHPEATKVVTIGYPVGGGEPIVCVESRAEYRRIIDNKLVSVS